MCDVYGGSRNVVPNKTIAVSHMRTGRLPLPAEVAGLTPRDVPSLAAVDGFADRMAELPCSSWLAVGRPHIENASRLSLRAAPRAILEATINDAGLALAAWYVRDAIDTSAYYASIPVRRWTSAERRCFAAAHAVAEDAALALLTRAFLASEDFDILCAPFAHLVDESVRGAR